MRKKSMNKAVKSLSLVLALSMGFTLVPGFGVQEAEAAAKSGVVLHGKKKVFSAKKGTSAYIGEKKVDLDLLINGRNISKWVKWSSSKGSVVSVNKKTGKLTAKKNGKAIITAVYGRKKYKALVKVFTRAESVTVEDSGVAVTEINLTEGDSKTLNANYKLSDNVLKAGGVSSTYNTYVTADNSEVVSLSKAKASTKDFTVTANKAGESYIDVVGSQSSAAKASADKKKVTARIKVVVAGKFAGKQTGAKKITVTGKNLSANKTDYKINGASDNIESVTINSSATEAVIEMKIVITDGDYTVEYSGQTSTFRGETAKPVNVDVPSKYLVLKGDNSSEGGTIEYNITNQFGEDVTKTVSGLDVHITGIAGTPTANPSTGLIDVAGMAANLPLDTKVNLNINKVDAITKLIGNFDLKIAAKSQASSVTVKGVYNINTKKPYTLAVNNSENTSARLLVEVKDQYGRIMKNTEGVNILAVGGLTGLGINGSLVYSDKVEIDGVDYIAIPFTGIGTVKAGSVEVTFIALFGTSGNNTTKTTINIAGTKQVAKFTATAPAEVYAKESTYFTYSATNSAGTAITDYATLSNENYGVKLPVAFSWENGANGVAKLKYDATKDPQVNAVVWSDMLTQMPSNGIFTIAANMQPAIVQFTVYAPAIPTNIRNFTVDGITPGITTDNVIRKIKIVDNKGRELTDLSSMSDYYLGVKKNNAGGRISYLSTGVNGTGDASVKLFKLSELKSGNLQFKDNGAALEGYISEDFTFAIHKDKTGTNKVAGSEINVKVTVADIKSLTNFNINLPSTLYSTTAGSEYDNVQVVVTGNAPDGSTVMLGDVAYTLDCSENIANDGAKTLKPSLVLDKAKKGDFTAEIGVVPNDGKGNRITKSVTVSNKEPSVTKVEARVAELKSADINAAGFNTIKDALVITDNYTSEINGINPSTAITKSMLQGVKLVSSSNPNLKVNKNNTTLVTFSGAAAGDMITIQVTFKNGVTGTFNFKLTA